MAPNLWVESLSLSVGQILSYSGGQQYQLGSPELMSRLKFVADPSRGDASISITGLQVSDTSTYQCKVKKPPGIDSRKVTLVVLGKDWDIRLLFSLTHSMISFCFTGSTSPLFHNSLSSLSWFACRMMTHTAWDTFRMFCPPSQTQPHPSVPDH